MNIIQARAKVRLDIETFRNKFLDIERKIAHLKKTIEMIDRHSKKNNCFIFDLKK